MSIRDTILRTLGGVPATRVPELVQAGLAPVQAELAATRQSIGDEMRTALSAYGQAWTAGLEDMLRGRGIGGYRKAAFSNHALTYACMRLIAQAVAAVPFKLWRKAPAGTEREQVLAHPILDRLAEPNSDLYSDGCQFIEMLVLYLLGGGNAWLLLDALAPRTKVPYALTVLGLGQINPVIDHATWKLLSWKLSFGYQPARLLPPDELAHVKFSNPNDGSQILGLGPVQAAQSRLDASFARERYDAAFFQNGAEPGVVLKFDPREMESKKPLTKDAMQVAREIWTDRHQGADKAHNVALLNAGWSLAKTGMSQRDMQFVQAELHDLRAVGFVFGVPSVKLNDFEHAGLSREGFEIGNRALAEDVTVPLCRRLSLFLNRVLVQPAAPELEGAFDTDEIPALRDNLDRKIDRVVKLVGVGYSLNGALKAADTGLDPMPWGDEQPQIKLPALGALPAPVRQRPTVVRNADPAPASALTADEEREVARTAIWRAFATSLKPLERAYFRKVRRHFLALQRETLGNLDAALSRSARAISLRELLFNLAQANGKLRTLSRPFFEQAITLGANGVAVDLGTSPIGLESPSMQAFLELKDIKIVGINSTRREELRATLGEGLKAGEGGNALAARVGQVFEASLARARSIARTEISGTVNGARFVEMQAHGVTRHSWMSSRDNHVRQPPTSEFDHAIDGETVAVGEPFSNGLLFAGDPDGEPGNTVNCLPGNQRIAGAILGVSKAFYAGPIVEIETWAGHRLTVTVNHPILTPRGFIPAYALREGDDILCEPIDLHRRPARWDVQDQDGPPTIEQVFEALRTKGARRTHSPRVGDFYGDARYFKGEIEVVAAGVMMTAHDAPCVDLDLMIEEQSVMFAESQEQGDFIPAQLAVGMPSGKASATSSRTPRGAHLSADSVRIVTQRPPFQSFGIAPRSCFAPMLSEDSHHSQPRYPISLRESEYACPSIESSEDLRVGQDKSSRGNLCRLGATTDLIPSFPRPLGNRAAFDSAQLAADLVRRYPGRVAADRIRSLRRRDFLGPVYDVHTKQGYFAGGHNATVLQRNCRCLSLPGD